MIWYTKLLKTNTKTPQMEPEEKITFWRGTNGSRLVRNFANQSTIEKHLQSTEKKSLHKTLYKVISLAKTKTNKKF